MIELSDSEVRADYEVHQARVKLTGIDLGRKLTRKIFNNMVKLGIYKAA